MKIKINRIVVFSDSFLGKSLRIITTNTIKRLKMLEKVTLGFSGEIVFVLVKPGSRKDFETTLELSKIDPSVIIDFGEHIPDEQDEERVLGNILTPSSLKKICDAFNHACRRTVDNTGAVTPIFA